MSRAFVKEMEDAPDPGVVRPQSQHPNYVTPGGLKQLEERLEAAKAAGDDSGRIFWQARVDSAIVKKSKRQRAVVDFGATVSVQTPDGKEQTYTIVGEDEAEPLRGKISWISPLAQALMEQKTGAKVTWRRPAGDLPITIVKIA